MLQNTSLFWLLLSVVCTLQLQAQTQFQKFYGNNNNDRNYHIAPTHDGGIIATGYTDDVSGNKNDAFLIKVNQFGKVEWAKTYGDKEDDHSWDVITTQNHDIVGVGYSTSFGTPYTVGTVTRTDSAGNVRWLAGSFSLSFQVNYYRVIETSTGHLLAAGLAGSSSNSDEMIVSKFTPNGQHLWSKTVGTSGSDEIMGMTETSQGDYLLAGLTGDPNGQGRSDFAAVKLDSSGSLIWKYSYGGSESDRLNSVVEVQNAYYFLGWSKSAGQGDNDVVVMKTDTAGKIDWVKAYGSDRSELAFNMVYEPEDTTLVLAGYTEKFSSSGKNDNRNTYLLKIDLDGSKTWDMSYGYSGRDGHWPTGLVINQDPGYYVMGSSNNGQGGDYNPYLIKTDLKGRSGCNQKAPNFSTSSITTWKARSFGSVASPSTSSASGTVNGAKWNLNSSSACCKLVVDEIADAFLCPGDTVELAVSNIPGYNYKWLRNNQTLGTDAQLEVTYGAPGNYDLEVSAGTGGCAASYIFSTVTNGKAPSLELPSDTAFCDGDSVALQVNTQDVMEVAWYDQNNNMVSDSFILWRKVSDSIIVEVLTTDNCVFSDSVQTIAKPLPQFDLGNDTSLCQGDTAVVNAPTQYQYQWLGGFMGPTQRVLQADTLVLEAVDNGCSTTDTIRIGFYDLPNFSLKDTVTCPETSVRIQGPENMAVYNWSNDSVGQFNTLSDSGTFWLEVVDINQCTNRDTFSFGYFSVPDSIFSTDTMNYSQQDTLDAGAEWAEYRWSTGDTTQTITIEEDGWYSVDVITQNGCSLSDSIYLRMPIGLQQTSSSLLQLYPNPASEWLNISVDPTTSVNWQWTLRNANGQAVWTGQGQNTSISVRSLPQGLYLLTGQSATQVIQRQVVVE